MIGLIFAPPTPIVTATATVTRWVVPPERTEPAWHLGGWSNVWQGLATMVLGSLFTLLIQHCLARRERKFRAQDQSKLDQAAVRERSREGARPIGELIMRWAAEIEQLDRSDYDRIKDAFALGRSRQVELHCLQPLLQRDDLQALVVNLAINLFAWSNYVKDEAWVPSSTVKDRASDHLRECSLLLMNYAAGGLVKPEEVKALFRKVSIDIREIAEQEGFNEAPHEGGASL